MYAMLGEQDLNEYQIIMLGGKICCFVIKNIVVIGLIPKA